MLPLVIPNLRHCTNKCKLEREGINKEKDKEKTLKEKKFILKSPGSGQDNNDIHYKRERDRVKQTRNKTKTKN